MKDALWVLFDFQDKVAVGYVFCIVVLGVIGFAEVIRRRWRSGLANLLLAAISLWVILATDHAMS
jgi:hypothetical protein